MFATYVGSITQEVRTCMIKPKDPRELAEAILSRSVCAVQVGAAIVDRKGRILSWGWNSSGPDGYGMHAEHHAILRANLKRLRGATIYVASQRNRNQKCINSKPCEACHTIIKWAKLSCCYRDAQGDWQIIYKL